MTKHYIPAKLAPTLDKCRTWPMYHLAYLDYMIKTGHPDLARSNYNASTWHERNGVKK